VHATFWLLEAPDSLAEQSRRNPDGYGIATFAEDGTPQVEKRPAAAYEDEQFARDAREEASSTFLAHFRYASTGAMRLENTHPFEQDKRVFAHNGHVGGLEQLEAELGDYMRLVHGDTDSERVFALITKETDRAGGDVRAGIEAAVTWIAQNLPLFALNFLLADAECLWAFRYPQTHDLLMLERAAGGQSGSRHFEAASAAGRIRVRSGNLGACPSVVFATEPMDEDPGWRQIESGSLVHVDRKLGVAARTIIDVPPAHQLSLADLSPHEAASQQPAHSSSAA
jgi:predicted glutamine amidotransferase